MNLKQGQVIHTPKRPRYIVEGKYSDYLDEWTVHRGFHSPAEAIKWADTRALYSPEITLRVVDTHAVLAVPPENKQ